MCFERELTVFQGWRVPTPNSAALCGLSNSDKGTLLGRITKLNTPKQQSFERGTEKAPAPKQQPSLRPWVQKLSLLLPVRGQGTHYPP